LEQWLRYLGVAQNVEIKDAGKFGRQLKVRTEAGGDLHDLTHVGVGVSQVLPILVMCLLAPTPCLLLFEQPELHLHPRVQARLADFFLAMGRLDKQCILETHSEYLVDRLRLRIAESESTDILEMVKIFFTEKVQGDTVCKSVELTEFGSIKNWPDDFFDQSAEASSKILRAASAKRTKAIRKQS
jgi:predicted ATPase